MASAVRGRVCARVILTGERRGLQTDLFIRNLRVVRSKDVALLIADELSMGIVWGGYVRTWDEAEKERRNVFVAWTSQPTL